MQAQQLLLAFEVTKIYVGTAMNTELWVWDRHVLNSDQPIPCESLKNSGFVEVPFFSTDETVLVRTR